jgi:glycosyltransferase involved in cell wall biosynthesis
MKKDTSVTFSIIIPTKDRPKDFKNCISSIINQKVLPHELIVVDASSDSISIVNQKSCEKIINNKIKLIYLRSTPGVNKQRNLGADKANSDIIFFLDDDVILEEEYCSKILEVYKLRDNQDLGGVQGCILDYYNPTWINRTFKKLFFMTRAAVDEKSRFLPSLGYVYILKPKEIIEVEAMPSLICSYYKKVFDEFRFDETFDRCTDLELSYRVSRRYKLYQTPYAVASHHHSKETHLNIRKLNKLYVIYTHKLVKKHMPSQITNWLAYCWSVIGELILSAIKTCVHLSPAPVLGTLEGITQIITNKDSDNREN